MVTSSRLTHWLLVLNVDCETERKPQLCPPPRMKNAADLRPATYDAAGLIGAFDGKILNEPPILF